MRNNTILAGIFFALIVTARPASAIPLFAQRYHLQCSACHTVLPELNAFGNQFRAHGYQLTIPKTGTTGIAVRYQMEYEANPVSGSRRFSPGGVLLSNADIGRVSAFVHYNLGAGGGPSGLFLGYLATYNQHTQTLYRAGLFELPLAQSPGQRLDDLAPYGYYGAHVGLNDLSLSSPRWGVQIERTVGVMRFDFISDLGEFKGAAYGGKPISTGETTSAAAPEYGFFVRAPLIGNTLFNNPSSRAMEADIGASALTGTRSIVQTARPGFDDAYSRYGLLAHAQFSKLDVQGEQWWGNDSNIDGFGTLQASSGGYVRLKYYPTPHMYLAVRYDATANPFATRDIVYYAAFHVTQHARLIVQQVQTIGGQGALGAAITIGVPWPKGL